MYWRQKLNDPTRARKPGSHVIEPQQVIVRGFGEVASVCWLDCPLFNPLRNCGAVITQKPRAFLGGFERRLCVPCIGFVDPRTAAVRYNRWQISPTHRDCQILHEGELRILHSILFTHYWPRQSPVDNTGRAGGGIENLTVKENLRRS